MTLPAREIPGSGPENMQNMLQLQNHKKLKTSFKYYTEHISIQDNPHIEIALYAVF